MDHISQSRALLAVLVVACIAGRSCYSDNASTWTHEDILTVLRDQEGRINDFLIEFDTDREQRTESGDLVGQKRERVRLMTKGSLFRTRKILVDPQTQEVIFDQEFAGDGSTEYFSDQAALYGTIRSKLPEQCVIRQSWAETYLLSVMRSPRRKGNGGFEGNLIGALEEAPKGIKISEESVNDRRIVVLTRFSSPGVPHSEIRLDPQMNFAVLSKAGIGPNEGHFGSVNSDFVEVIEGVWLPRKVEYFRRDKPPIIVRETLRVQTLGFNKGFDKADFAVRFPDGARVKDLDARMDVTLSPKELDGAYFDHLLNAAEDQNLIDVHHVPGANGVPSALEDVDQAEGVPARAAEGTLGVTDRSRLSWKMAVTFVMLGLAGIVYLLSRTMSRRKA